MVESANKALLQLPERVRQLVFSVAKLNLGRKMSDVHPEFEDFYAPGHFQK